MTEPMGERGRQGAAPLGGHTPGPWKVSDYVLESGLVQVEALGEVVALADRGNARLIAAAPELLEALEAVLSMDMAEALMLPSGAHPSAQLARAALAKARGEQ